MSTAAPSREAIASELFAVNFSRQRTVPLSVRRFFANTAVTCVVINAGVLLLLLGMAYRARLASAQLERQSQAQTISPAAVRVILSEIATLKDHARGDVRQLNTLIAQEQQRFPVAGKLSALTKTVPARTWMTSIAGNREGRSLIIQAAYVADPEQPYALPTKPWIESLNADPVFRKNLKRLELRSSSQKTQGKAELVLLELDAAWGS